VATEYLLQVVAPVHGKRKRQTFATQYIGANGGVIGNCSAALKFVFSDQEMLSGGSPVAVGPGVNSAPLGPTPPNLVGRSINTAFSINANYLVWYNLLFDNGGFASFCITNSSVVDAVFHGSAPVGCSPINIAVVLGMLPLSGDKSIGDLAKIKQLPYALDTSPTRTLLRTQREVQLVLVLEARQGLAAQPQARQLLRQPRPQVQVQPRQSLAVAELSAIEAAITIRLSARPWMDLPSSVPH
jgi:hypothetical protein